MAAFEYLKKHSAAFKDILFNSTEYKNLPEDDIPSELYDSIDTLDDSDLLNQDLGHSQYTDELEEATKRNSNVDIKREINTGIITERGLNFSQAAALQSITRPRVVVQTRLGAPLSEYQDCLYLHKCFPALFWNGYDDLVCNRPIYVSIREWLDHKIRFANPMFMTDPHFVLICHNMMIRHESVTKVHTMISGNRLDSSLLDAVDDILPGDFICVNPLTDEVIASSD